MALWQPSAPLENLKRRAEIIAQIRDFFSSRNVLEVDTGLLSLTTATDPHLDSIAVNQIYSDDDRQFFLQTSPEFAMKKLLAAGSGSIYQICKAFRQSERSKRHNPEFSMLEWYRVGFDEQQLMDEVAELVSIVTGRQNIPRITYRELFEQHLSIDPHSCTDARLLEVARESVDFSEVQYQRDDLLHLLLAEVIEPALLQDCFVYDIPASMAALAVIDKDEQGVLVAKRFELFLSGMEIANGYRELTDPLEQRRRFESDILIRKNSNRMELPVDNDLVAALEEGLPACAGVAIGVDRLVMVAIGAQTIDEVIAYPLDKGD